MSVTVYFGDISFLIDILAIQVLAVDVVARRDFPSSTWVSLPRRHRHHDARRLRFLRIDDRCRDGLMRAEIIAPLARPDALLRLMPSCALISQYNFTLRHIWRIRRALMHGTRLAAMQAVSRRPDTGELIQFHRLKTAVNFFWAVETATVMIYCLYSTHRRTRRILSHALWGDFPS